MECEIIVHDCPRGTDNWTRVQPTDLSIWFGYIKRPITVRAVQMQHDFMVKTLEGTMNGKAGDYLIRGAHGEFYPCAKDIFGDTYDEVPLRDPKNLADFA